ncbi:MAG: hypothetical protein CO149_08280 [Nitrospirae bacterium CG_4_9_14_3_um_filter_51_5]|nr:MAG: hypothetical protein CO149_08280 [Nitrospirae bacterium CG_4_9_14_3_um_filter_51_5]
MKTSLTLEGGWMGRIRQSIGVSVAAGCLGMSVVILNPNDALSLFGFSEEEKTSGEVTPAIPSEYQGKQMPDGWLTDPRVLAEGKAIYEGAANPKVNCAECHGLDGQPTRKGRGAPDFSDPIEAQEPDALWFWRISEGIPRTKMGGHKKHLTEEERWQVLAYIRTLTKTRKQ